ncbi:MAG: response regulator [Phycisphaerae bacterium]|nr:response regulator [Phycisphaerae bacterium]
MFTATMSGSVDSKPVRTIRLEENTLEEILARLDGSAFNDAGRRADGESFRFRQAGCTLHVKAAGAVTPVIFAIVPRRIGPNGLNFLHGGFLHPGTRCCVRLNTLHGSWADLEAKVERCEHVQGSLHDVRIRFDTQIDSSQFTFEAVKNRVLLVEDNPFIARATTLILKGLHCEVVHASDGDEVLQQIGDKPFDLILMDIEMPRVTGFDAFRQLREIGYSGKVVALTALTEEADKQRCLEAGFDRYLPKPCTREAFASLLQSLRSEPILSTMAGDPTIAPLLAEFVSSLADKVKSIREADLNADSDALGRIVRGLKGEAGCYGFDPISAAAGQLELAISRKAPTEQLSRLRSELVNLCLLARANAN